MSMILSSEKYFLEFASVPRMEWRIDLALLLQSNMQISLDELERVLQTQPQNIEPFLALVSLQERELLHEQLAQRAHQSTKEWVLRNDVKLVFYGDANYPRNMMNWLQAPQVLWYLGQPVWNKHSGLAVVGSRNPSSQTQQWLNWQLGDFLKARKTVVISGGALGVDQAAHWLSVRKSVPTVALMPTGMKNRYPPNFYKLEPAILDGGGAILTPFLPDWPLYKVNFARRNQVIAAMSRVTFIAEARRRSGTLLTAKAAHNQDKPIGVLPCSPMCQQGLGGLDWIKDGHGEMVRDAQDLMIMWDRYEQAKMF